MNIFKAIWTALTKLFKKINIECKQILGTPPYGRIKASSTLPLRKKQTCQPNDGYLLSNKGWCARRRFGKYIFSLIPNNLYLTIFILNIFY